MASPRLLDALPVLVREGLISAEQAERIRARFAPAPGQGGSRMVLVSGILGGLLVGLGVVLIVAHNWDSLTRSARLLLALAPVLLGQLLVWHALRRRPGVRAWAEGSAAFLACALCAATALISQIYHIEGPLHGYLLVCALLVLPLLYLPGSLVAALGYLVLAAWQGAALRAAWPGQLPWAALALLLAAAPMYVREARAQGERVGFWWLSLFAALAVGITAQLFTGDSGLHVCTALLATASAFTLVPWLHPGRPLRTWPWALVGGAAALITFFVLSFREPWEWLLRTGRPVWVPAGDAAAAAVLIAFWGAAYAFALKRRKPLERWPYPEALGAFAACAIAGLIADWLAPLLANAALLATGVLTLRQGIGRDSMPRMNMGLAIIGLTVILRFLDADMSFLLRGLAFIAVGAGFLFMNLRMLRARSRQRSQP